MHHPVSPQSSRSLLHFLDQVSPEYLEALEQQYEQDPTSVSQDWGFFFEAFRLGQGQPIYQQVSEDSAIIDELRVLELISAYRQRGHLQAEVDPLERRVPPFDLHLDLGYFKLDKIPKDRVFQAATEIGLAPSTLDEIVRHLKATYCRKVGVEFSYIRDEKVYNWLKQKIDSNHNTAVLTREQRLTILKHLAEANHFENFLQNNYMGQKRFSIEGGEALIPALKSATERSAELGVQEILIGMAHRGRLNVLINILQKPVEEIFKEFEGAELPQFEEATGDVKYHQGFSTDCATARGSKVHLSLAPNPSHLEFVDPVVEGMARAKIEERYGNDSQKLLPILIHGDAAVIGQGIVAETLNLSQLEGYKTGGTLHIVINNQIGFTTDPSCARSSVYCTDFAKALQCPIFHVNGNDPEAVVHAVQLATEFRMTFQRDVFIDLICYRKYGHNEGDEPRFTQPVMYDVIGRMKNPFQLYRDQLESEGVCDRATSDSFISQFDAILNERRAKVKNSQRILELDSMRGHWSGYSRPKLKDMLEVFPTGLAPEHLDRVIDVIHSFPPEIKVLPKFQKMFEARKKKIEGEDEMDWAVGEALAFGSLLLEGFPIRLSGQDSVRGTFSHRHAAFTHIESMERYFPLAHLDEKQARFQVYDSPLSEAGVLGFDYGYSLANPKCLTIWEAQFGDFANGAQVIIDQFISSAETKWYRMSGITLLLPHGYEGQGPEHSSARLERFLQLCSQLNMQVCYPTTPAQICHLLRRQVIRTFRKPLIVMTPKSLLRHPMAISRRADFLKGGFNPVLEDHCKNPERIVICSGKVYYDLKKRAMEENRLDKILFVRLEQIYPLDIAYFQNLQTRFPGVPWIWCQEEPKNMGAWAYLKLRFLEAQLDISYAGRPASASPATGSPLQHQRELEAFLKDALGY